MNPKFKMHNGEKFLVDANGFFLKEAGEMIKAGDDAVEFVEKTDAELESEAIKTLQTTVTAKIDATVESAIKSLDLPKELASALTKGVMQTLATKKADVQFTPGFDVETKSNSVLTKDDVLAGLKSVKGARGKSFEFTAKTLSELNSLTGELPEEDRQPGVTTLAKEYPTTIMDIATVRTTNSKTVTYVEVLNETGAPATVAELDAFPEKDWNFVVRTANVYKVAVMTKASNEILEDTPELVSVVKTEMAGDLDRKVDQKLLVATGVNDITGIATIAPAFTGGALANQIATPNRLDVIRAALSEVRVNGKGKFRPNAIMINPVDSALLEMEKGADGHYVMAPFVSADRKVISNVRVIENDNMTPGDFIIGDFTRFYVYIRRGASLQVATENGTDFEKEIVTMRLAMRLASFVKVNENAAFVQGDFATAQTILSI